MVAPHTRRQEEIRVVGDFLFPALLKQDVRAKGRRAVSSCHFIGPLVRESYTDFRNVRGKDWKGL